MYKYVEHEFSLSSTFYVNISEPIYSTMMKKNDFVCLFVCLSVCPLRHSAVLRCMEPKLARVVEARCPRSMVNFSKQPHQRAKVIKRSICLRNTLRPPNLVGRTPDKIVMHCWGQRSCSGQLGSTRSQIA